MDIQAKNRFKKMYILILQFDENRAIPAEHVVEHTKWVKKSFLNEVFIIAGQQVDTNGGVILASNITKEKLNELINHDPFVRHGYVIYKVIHFEPVFFQEKLLNHRQGNK